MSTTTNRTWKLVRELSNKLNREGHDIQRTDLLATGDYVVTLNGNTYTTKDDPRVDEIEHKNGYTVLYVKKWSHPLYYTMGLKLIDGLIYIALVVLFISAFRITEYS